MEIRLLDFSAAGEFEWSWPSHNVEKFERSWRGRIAIDGARFEFRHALGHRHVYGKGRVHGVTWLAGAPMVEGVEADDYRFSRALLSLLRRFDKKHVRANADIPREYEDFLIVDHRDEICAPYSPRSFAVKITEDKVAAWATHAAIRAALLQRLSVSRRATVARPRNRLARPEAEAPQSIGVEANPQRIVDALVTFGRSQARRPSKPNFAPTPDAGANEFVASNPLAFLLAVIADQGMPAERAWRLPYDLNRRLGHLEPARSPDAVNTFSLLNLLKGYPDPIREFSLRSTAIEPPRARPSKNRRE